MAKQGTDLHTGTLVQQAIYRYLTNGNPAGHLEAIRCEYGRLARAAEARVAFLPGDSFYANGEGSGYLRLSFSRYRPETIKEGTARICQVLRRLCNEEFPGREKKKRVPEVVPLM